MSTPKAVWTPLAERVNSSNLRRFAAQVGERHGIDIDTYADLHAWSVANPGPFWAEVWDFAEVAGERGERLVEPADEFWQWRFLPDARLNVAETLLRSPSAAAALIYRGEDGEFVDWSRARLHHEVSRLQQALLAEGVQSGDRVAAWLPNRPEGYALMLAAASIGAVFSSTSPDFGTAGVLDRFGQIEPTVLVGTPTYPYGGKTHDVRAKLVEVSAALPSLRRTVSLGDDWDAWLEPHTPGPVHFAPLPFDHPWYILYSSGTTGKPKCIVHRAGGVLVKHLSEQMLHCDIAPGDRVFYFTTAGWMMWNWLASCLATDAALVLYDGSPFHPDGNAMFDLAADTGVTMFGTSAKFIDACNKAKLRPLETHDLSALRTIASTGSPLVPEGFDYVYQHISPDVHLASISGGTDLCGCLVMGDPTGPVYRGEIQVAGLGMDIDVIDDDGRSVEPGEQGELICRLPFPSMPLHFWDDADGSRYRAAYFDEVPGVWHHGDFAQKGPAGGYLITGRSDATLNPGGVRIGTAEIYRLVDAMPEITESLVIGQQWENDTRIVLFVVLEPGHTLDDDLITRIRADIRAGISPRHVPAVITAVPDLPRTRSGKLSELAVRDVVHGRPVKNTEALANPESLTHFQP